MLRTTESTVKATHHNDSVCNLLIQKDIERRTIYLNLIVFAPRV
jgi:hypothetical protein